MSHCLLCGHEHETTGCPQVYSANDYQSLQALYVEKLSHIRALEAENKRLMDEVETERERIIKIITDPSNHICWLVPTRGAIHADPRLIRAALANEEGR